MKGGWKRYVKESSQVDRPHESFHSYEMPRICEGVETEGRLATGQQLKDMEFFLRS